MAPQYPDMRTESGLRVTSGLITCEEMDVIHEDVRRNVFSQTGAIAVTWESAELAAFARTHHMSFGCFRMISDVNEADVKHLRSPQMLRKITMAANTMRVLLGY
jgi:nucleoside phosphorylase